METASPLRRYREIEVRGTSREMGRQIGEAARQEIRSFAEVALARVNMTVRVSRERALWVAARSAEFAARYAPHMMDELYGVAEGSGVAIEDLMLLQVRNQLRPESDGACTSLSVVAAGKSLVAQNWDNDPGLDPFTIVLTRRPNGKPALMNITQAGLIAYVGFNDSQIGLCLNTLPAPAREVGVPHYFTVRAIYEAVSLEEAVEAVRRADRAIPANIMLATPQGPADLEVSLDGVHVLTPARPDRRQPSIQGAEHGAIVTHTNHCLHADLVRINDEFPELIQSKSRQRRIDELLANGAPPDLKAIQTALSDHEVYPRSICRHANDDPCTGHWQTTFSVIIETDERRMHISRGTPCNHPYETYVLTM